MEEADVPIDEYAAIMGSALASFLEVGTGMIIASPTTGHRYIVGRPRYDAMTLYTANSDLSVGSIIAL